MKVLFFTTLIFLSNFLLAQQNEENSKPKSKIERTLKEEGVVIKKEFIDILKIGTTYNYVEFKKLILTDLKNNTKTSGVYIYGYEYNTISSSGSCYIDDNKLQGLIEFLILANEKVKTKELTQVEYVFNLENLNVLLYNSKQNYSKTFSKEESEYNYWYLTFDIGTIRTVDIRLQKLDDISTIISKLKEVNFN